jgi:hypothetical protein
MNVLTRQDIIAQLRGTKKGALTAQQLADWAFDQFYAEEEGAVQFEPGYRKVIAVVLDDLMFADTETFNLTADDVERMVQQLEHTPAVLDEGTEWEDDDV